MFYKPFDSPLRSCPLVSESLHLMMFSTNKKVNWVSKHKYIKHKQNICMKLCILIGGVWECEAFHWILCFWNDGQLELSRIINLGGFWGFHSLDIAFISCLKGSGVGLLKLLTVTLLWKTEIQVKGYKMEKAETLPLAATFFNLYCPQVFTNFLVFHLNRLFWTFFRRLNQLEWA